MLKNVVPVRRVLPLRNVLFMDDCCPCYARCVYEKYFFLAGVLSL